MSDAALPSLLPGLPAAAVHLAFELLAFAAGFAFYRRNRRHAGVPGVLAAGEFAVAVGCIFGAALGNKLVFWLEFPHRFALVWDQPLAWVSGQSMVGGLLGGLLGVELAKRLAGIGRSTGDAFVYPVLLGLAIGRVGCFLAGLADGTHGNPTALPWGVDYGDGIARHPAQLYEIGFVALLAAALRGCRTTLAAVAGSRFRLMLIAYLAWRFGIDSLKPVPYAYPGGLSGIQAVCLLALAIYVPLSLRWWRAALAAPRLST